MRRAVIVIIPALVVMALFNAWWIKTSSPQVQIYTEMQTRAVSVEARRLGYTLLWEIRKTLAAYFWMQAEVYFHGGIRHVDEIHGHHHDHAHGTDIFQEHTTDVAFHVEKECDHEHEIRKPSLLRPYVPRPDHGTEHVPQMMPWYWLTTVFDPYFIEAYHNGAYYLAFHLNRHQEAFDYLDRGLRYNPGNLRILVVYAWIYTRLEEYSSALHYLEQVDTVSLDDEEDIISFKVFYYQLKAHTFEELGNYQHSLINWEKVYELTRRQSVLIHRIEPLRKKITGN